MQTQNSSFWRKLELDIPFLCVPLILALAITFVTQPPKVGINNTALEGKAGVSVRFVASTKPTPGPGVKSNLSWTLSLFSFRSGSFPWAEFWVRSQEEWFEFRSHTHRQFHAIMCFKAVASLARKENAFKSLLFIFFSLKKNAFSFQFCFVFCFFYLKAQAL